MLFRSLRIQRADVPSHDAAQQDPAEAGSRADGELGVSECDAPRGRDRTRVEHLQFRKDHPITLLVGPLQPEGGQT